MENVTQSGLFRWGSTSLALSVILILADLAACLPFTPTGWFVIYLVFVIPLAIITFIFSAIGAAKSTGLQKKFCVGGLILPVLAIVIPIILIIGFAGHGLADTLRSTG